VPECGENCKFFPRARLEKVRALPSIQMPRGLTATTLRALRHRNFRLFFIGQVISVIGTWMESVAQAWLIYRLTGSSVLLGTMTFAGQIPILLLAPLGGHMADRHSRHRIIVITQIASMAVALTLAWLTLTNRILIWELFTLGSLYGIINAFDMPARQSFLIEMVGKEDLINAIALNSTMFSSARMLGPAIAGVLVAAVGEGWCFFANGISYIAVIAGLLMMRLAPFERHPSTEESPIDNIRGGFSYVNRTRPVRALVTRIGVISFAGLPFATLLPIFAQEILHAGSGGFGLLMSCFGFGSLAAALWLASRSGLAGLSKWLAVGALCFPVALAGFAFSKNLWLSGLLLFVAGLTLLVQAGASNTLIQSMVPDHYRGRVMAVYSMSWVGLNPFGAMVAGFVAARLGAPDTILLGAVACLISAITFALRVPTFRSEARQLINATRTTA
jgi:MFS family permease